jgi:3-hydroxy-9,10-secoandrosta-1,3,5(10)-triene-9,17-dione monooxygenase reductase component
VEGDPALSEVDAHHESIPVAPERFRRVVSHFPTGVAVVTATSEGRPVGLTVATFTPVSLEPMLVGFLPRQSWTWSRIEASGHFCVNVLAYHQEPHCMAFASKVEDRFEGISWHPSGSGSPILDGALAWIDCSLHQVVNAGDHFFVMGRVLDLDAPGETGPLVVYRSAYSRLDGI